MNIMINERLGQIKAKVIADSVNPNGARLTSYELEYHRYIHAEFMTHRVFSKNAASSRAIPAKKLIEIVRQEPMIPIHLGANQSGMSADAELPADVQQRILEVWEELGGIVADKVEYLTGLGLHKQVVNRPLEAFLPIKVVATGTEHENFFELRDSQFAQPEFQVLAQRMREARNQSEPKLLKQGEWHLPYISLADRAWVGKGSCAMEWDVDQTLCWLSASRCARTSHALGGLTKKEVGEEIQKGKDLFTQKHMSPFEHIATPADFTTATPRDVADLLVHLATPESKCPPIFDVRNLRGWRSMRSYIENGELQ
jgi:hypothetical protein